MRVKNNKIDNTKITVNSVNAAKMIDVLKDRCRNYFIKDGKSSPDFTNISEKTKITKSALSMMFSSSLFNYEMYKKTFETRLNKLTDYLKKDLNMNEASIEAFKRDFTQLREAIALEKKNERLEGYPDNKYLRVRKSVGF